MTVSNRSPQRGCPPITTGSGGCVTQVQALIKNFQHVRDLLEQICDINRQLLRPQEKV
ncbi:hypothetical protein SBV1_180057 [Verrucomicrobia bacterium]|nr:hypothetical protein SBV1_180057 [Verrucomicrobiota bacterium]